ncbi:hypothetical protein VHEMI08248 [[Torrubiella] hemipterigena]|uniref:CDP-diacylglycerol--serine O-phosphatidyltransferase n=2 Tax=[Torrubiella] hemipterigena TaxID=1531966 RepID=A0A0A1TPD8_9HYPO|nr:hypothetical protein VHEMI08248 [[Torrubiella] hemipterigena]
MSATKQQAQTFDMVRRLKVADYLTLSNALCGVMAIFASMQQRVVLAYLLVFLGYEFDRFDGMVARMRNECSELGKELDSFSDLVSFCVAPAVTLYCMGFDSLLDQAVLALYVLCGLARLARFNVAAQSVPRDEHGKPLYHEGLATPYAGLLLMTASAVACWSERAEDILSGTLVFAGEWYEFHGILAIVVTMSIMMASKRLHIYFDGGYSIPAATALVLAGCWFAPRL